MRAVTVVTTPLGLAVAAVIAIVLLTGLAGRAMLYLQTLPGLQDYRPARCRC